MYAIAWRFGRWRLFCGKGEETMRDTTGYAVAMMLAMFWNVENFFYPERVKYSDSLNPKVEMNWGWKRFAAKRDAIAKTIIATKDKYGNFPSFIGFCEIGERRVLEQLCVNTPLLKLGYRILHKDSPDGRGIDVAMLYLPDRLRVTAVRYLAAEEAKTREILYAKGVARLLEGEDTLHIFVNHWPSKLGGASSAALRERIAKLLQRKADSIAEQNPSAKIILMGDFNDSPTGSAIAKLKGFRNLSQELQESLKKENTPAKASHKYNGRWEMLDQFLTRGIEGARADIFASPHLLQGDKKFLSQRIKRTFIGPRYNGGVSDHLPIVLIVCNPTDSSLRPEWNDKNSK